MWVDIKKSKVVICSPEVRYYGNDKNKHTNKSKHTHTPLIKDDLGHPHPGNWYKWEYAIYTSVPSLTSNKDCITSYHMPHNFQWEKKNEQEKLGKRFIKQAQQIK